MTEKQKNAMLGPIPPADRPNPPLEAQNLPPCPRCGAPFPTTQAPRGPALDCAGCALRLERSGQLFDALGERPRESNAARVEEFYRHSPFPGYAPGLTLGDLVERARRSPFLATLERTAPTSGPILELGSGTSQTSAFLAAAASGRRVWAVDGCRASLEHAESFRSRVGLGNLHLLRADLFDLPLPRRAFPFVLSRGVVHHTPDPERATREVADRVAPGGLLVLGIYESMARRPHDLRRRAAQVFGRGFAYATDPMLRRGELDPEKARIWYEDQYRHPLEALLPLPRVAGWLEEAGFDWVRSVPPALDGDGLADERRPSAAALFLRRLGWFLRGPFDVDNGLVCLVARRRA